VADRLEPSRETFVVTDRQNELEKIVGESVTFGSHHEYCRASSIARIGLKKFASGEFADVASAEPMYLKDFVVRTPGGLR